MNHRDIRYIRQGRKLFPRIKFPIKIASNPNEFSSLFPDPRIPELIGTNLAKL